MSACPTSAIVAITTSSHFSQPAENLSHVCFWVVRISSALGIAPTPLPRRPDDISTRRARLRGCRTTRRVESCTMPTPTSWRRRAGWRPTRTPHCETASSRSATRAVTSCARPATPTSSSEISTPRSTRLADRHRSAEYIADEAAEIMNRKNFAATGSFLADDRGRALDLLGFSSQLVFNTFHNRRLRDWEHSGDVELALGAARAHNRGIVEFCAADPRLLPTCYVPLCSLDDAAAMADEAIEMGASALLIASGCPPGHSPSHVGLDGVWARAQEAAIPVVFHVGGTGDLIDKSYFRNGLPIPPDFHGGEENFRSVDYMGIPHPPMQTLATMIFDGVLERFPSLRFGVIEQGADLAAVVDAPAGGGVRRFQPVTRSASARCHFGRVSTCAGRFGRRRTRPRTSGGSSSRPAPRCACSRATTRMWRAAAGRSSASRRRSRTPTRTRSSGSTATTSSTSWGARPPSRGLRCSCERTVDQSRHRAPTTLPGAGARGPRRRERTVRVAPRWH